MIEAPALPAIIALLIGLVCLWRANRKEQM